MNRAIKIIAVLLIGLSSGCGDNNNAVISDVLGYVDIDTSGRFDDRAPKVAFDGVNYLVVYQDITVGSGTNHQIIGVFVSPDPAIGADIPFVIDTDNTSFTNDDLAPVVAFDGTNYLIVYQRFSNGGTTHSIIGARVDINGNILTGSPFVIDASADNLAPALTFDSTNSTYLVVYQQTVSPTSHSVIGAFVNKAGVVKPGSPFVIDASADDLAPAVATNGTNYLVAYEETVTSTDHDIIGVSVSSSGTVGTPFAIDISPDDDFNPSVATDGTNYLVAYEEIFKEGLVPAVDHDIIGAQVDSLGNVLSFIKIDNSEFDDRVPQVAFDGVNYLVVYQDQDPAVTDHDIIGARIDPDPTAEFPVFDYVNIDTSANDDLVPAVAFGATDYLVAYEEVFSSVDHDIFGALVTP